MKLFTLATTLVIAPTVFVGGANAALVDMGCVTQQNDEIGKMEYCVKADDQKAGMYYIDYADSQFQGKMLAYCMPEATGFRALNGTDETQVEHIARGFCNGLRTDEGMARQTATFAF